MRFAVLCVFVLALAALAASEPSGWGGYFQYANVPGWGQYEFGYNRGNHDHFTSRFEQGWGWKFKTKVRWGDKKGGYGEQYFDYQHSPKGWSKGHSHGHHGKHHLGALGSENVPTVLSPVGRLGAQPAPIGRMGYEAAPIQQYPQQQPQRQMRRSGMPVGGVNPSQGFMPQMRY